MSFEAPFVQVNGIPNAEAYCHALLCARPNLKNNQDAGWTMPQLQVSKNLWFSGRLPDELAYDFDEIVAFHLF